MFWADSTVKARWWCNFFHVGTRVGHGSGDFGQRAGHVARTDRDAGQPAGTHHAALDAGGQQQWLNVAAAQHRANFFDFEPARVVEPRGQPGCAFEQQVVGKPGDDGARDFARAAHRDTLGNGVTALRAADLRGQ